jgi:predicted DNA-binding antitoxin AbrB/MazE fold protein
MTKRVRVRYRRGVLELLGPLETLALEEGAELTVELSTTEPTPAVSDATAATAGAWEMLLDGEAFEQEIYAKRLHSNRPEVNL